MEFEGVWGIGHIIIFVCLAVSLAIGLVLVKKYVRKQQTYNLILLISGICLLVLIIINRVSSSFESLVLHDPEGYYTSWWAIIPDTLCGATSLYLAIALICCRKNHNRIPFHFLIYMVFISETPVFFYPDFLKDFAIYRCSAITSFLHHFVSLWSALVIVMSCQFKPTIKRWHIFPLNYIAYITLGLFERTVFNARNPFNIDDGLITSLPHLTSWYVLLLASTLAVVIFLVLYEHWKNHISFKLIFQQMLFLKQKS